MDYASIEGGGLNIKKVSSVYGSLIFLTWFHAQQEKEFLSDHPVWREYTVRYPHSHEIGFPGVW